jgi:tripartite-type tricarboxylate transporter receptor subunit TctC
MNAAPRVLLSLPDLRDGLDRIAYQARNSTPEEVAALVKGQLDIWRSTVLDAGIDLE